MHDGVCLKNNKYLTTVSRFDPLPLLTYIWGAGTGDRIPLWGHNLLWPTLLNTSDNTRAEISHTAHKHTLTGRRGAQEAPPLDQEPSSAMKSVLHCSKKEDKDLQEVVHQSQTKPQSACSDSVTVYRPFCICTESTFQHLFDLWVGGLQFLIQKTNELQKWGGFESFRQTFNSSLIPFATFNTT